MEGLHFQLTKTEVLEVSEVDFSSLLRAEIFWICSLVKFVLYPIQQFCFVSIASTKILLK